MLLFNGGEGLVLFFSIFLLTAFIIRVTPYLLSLVFASLNGNKKKYEYNKQKQNIKKVWLIRHFACVTLGIGNLCAYCERLPLCREMQLV